jgi:uncharacterized protein
MDQREIRAIAQELLASDSSSHGWDHTERVWNLCRHIGGAEGADLEILRLAAYLHDIGRPEEKASGGEVCHAMVGAERARRVLEEQGCGQDTVEGVAHCIASHRFRRNGEQPRTLEARVLFDADKLDAIGAVGIGRAFLFAGEVGARLHNPEADILNTQAYSTEDTAFREFSVKLRKVKGRMLTTTGKRLAEDRHLFMVGFFDRLTEEVQGKK